MRILVTGGAGFIGSALVRVLLRDDDAHVTVLDALTYAGDRANLPDDPRLAFVHGDITDGRTVDRLVAGADAVVNAAAETHVDRSIAHAAPFVTTNVLGTQVLLDAALRHGTARFLQVSTDEVYGSIERGSWDESAPVAPRSPYSASKAAGDLLALAYHRTHGLPVVVTRGANTFGPRQHPEKLIPRFVTRLLAGRTVPVYGDGGQVREWVHADDHARAIALVLAGGRPGEVYHVGAGVELTNLELTHRLLELCGAGPDRIEHVADRKGHDRRYSLDTTRIRTELGFRPAVDFAAGLAATVEHYRRKGPVTQ
ncbi:dTDP-glucose 4,6-dehydratase [Spirilliplanes yamanashiensis]|nr:dTDP-glucose 4,6-dehydratase [Spirilliplanes yamanashiensis]MDP9815646.1 dTDP-glucose 4,6-dehydratase [Spirilliplanes yamanashiensis]